MTDYDMEIPRSLQWVAGFILLVLCAFFIWTLAWVGWDVPRDAWTMKGVGAIGLGVVFVLSLLPLARKLLMRRPATGRWEVIPRRFVQGFSLCLFGLALTVPVVGGIDEFEQALTWLSWALIFWAASSQVTSTKVAGAATKAVGRLGKGKG